MTGAEKASLDLLGRPGAGWDAGIDGAANGRGAVGGGPLLEVRDLRVRYPRRPGLEAFEAVRGVGFDVPRRRTLGLVGESGSGKSSAALAVMRLVEPSAGTVRLGGVDLTALSGRALRRQRRRFQMIFQDPASSLNPRVRVLDLLTEPMALCGLGDRGSRAEAAEELLGQVGLPASSLGLFPHQFSGGQRQRLVIARALATRPELVVADEPVSALDAAVQAQILNLLADLRRDFGLTVLFISHDLGVVQHACHEVAVMRRGLVVERAPTRDLFATPAHPYTWALLAASVTDRGLRDALVSVFGAGIEGAAGPAGRAGGSVLSELSGLSGLFDRFDTSDRSGRSGGCDFPGCPLAEARCRREAGDLAEFEPGRFSRCRLAGEVRRQGEAVLELAGLSPRPAAAA